MRKKLLPCLQKQWSREGHQVSVISLHPFSEEKVEDRNGVRVYYLPLDNFYWPFSQTTKSNPLTRVLWHLREMWNGAAAKRVGKILDVEAPDVVHTHNITGFSVAVWKAVKQRKIRLVHTMHDYYLLCPRTTTFRDGKSCVTRCTSCRVLTANRSRASRLPDTVVSVSEFTLNKHKESGYFSGVASDVIYNIQAATPQLPPSTAALASKIAEPTDALTFGFIGRVEQEKGIETLLAATRHLEHPGWRLRIAGKGIEEYVTRLRDTYPDPRIEWLGFTTSSTFYKSVDVVVLPSLWNEPLPYVCVESLYSGRSLICARVGGLPEIAQLAKTVQFFPAGDVQQLAAAMNLAISESATWKISAAPPESVLIRFSEKNIVDRYTAVYQPETVSRSV